MKKTIITLSLLSCVGLGGFLTNSVKKDIENGDFPISTISKKIDNATITNEGYDTSKLPLSVLKYFIDIPAPEKNSFLFDYPYESFTKNVYRIKGDSYAHSYAFENANKHPLNTSLKKKLFKLSSSFLDKNGIEKIYRSKNSNVMLSSYIVEFENKRTISEIYRYTSQILFDNKNNSNILKEIDLLNNYVNTEAKYKRFNFVFTSKSNGFVLRHLVSEHLENNKPQKSQFRIVYRK